MVNSPPSTSTSSTMLNVMDMMRDPKAPPISEQTAILSGLIFTILYVAPFYISPTLRTSSLNSRDSPIVIKARVRAVLLSCLASTILTTFIHIRHGNISPKEILRLFGMWPINPLDILHILLLLSILFAGPLYETLLIDAAWKDFSIEQIKSTFWTAPTSHRNLTIAPWCEELVFRSLVISLYLLARVPPARIIFTSPLIFGVAHIHHCIEIIKTKTPPHQTFPPLKIWILAAAMSTFQFIYTSLFGFFAALVFLRTGNFFAVVAAHTFCNFMGLPRVWGRLGPVEMELEDLTPDFARVMAGPEAGPKLQGLKRRYRAKYLLGFEWTVGYYILLGGGAWSFYRLLWVLTDSGNALVTI